MRSETFTDPQTGCTLHVTPADDGRTVTIALISFDDGLPVGMSITVPMNGAQACFDNMLAELDSRAGVYSNLFEQFTGRLAKPAGGLKTKLLARYAPKPDNVVQMPLKKGSNV